MKKATILFLSATAILTYMVTGCKNYDDDIQDLNDRLDRIENVEIKSVSQQIDAINASLPKLEQTDAELKTYIESLKTTAAGLEKSIAETGRKIDEMKASLDKAIAEAKAGDEAVKEELVKSIESAKASVIAQLNSAKSDLENRLSLMESTIATLQTKDTELETKINNLKEYVDKELSGTKDWATATFATIDQYNAVVTDISTIQSSIEGLNASVEALENNLASRVNEEIKKALEPIRDQIAAEVLKSVQSSITETVTKLRSDIEAAYKAEIKSSIEGLEKSLKEWVNDALAGYSTVSQTDAKLEALKTELEGRLSSQKTYLEGLISVLSADLTTKITNNTALVTNLTDELVTVKEEVKKYSQTVIENTNKISEISQNIVNNTTIITDNSKLVEELKNQISSLQTEMNTKISELETKITLSTGGTDKETIIKEIDKLKTEYSEKISNLQTVLEGKIAENKVQIDSNKALIEANTKAIAENAKAIAELKASAAGTESVAQISEKVAGNAEAIAAQAKLIAENAAAITDNASAIAENTKHITALEQSLLDTKSDITEAYKSAIKTAIEELDGKLTDDAAKKVLEINNRITDEVKTITDAMEALTKRVDTLETELAALKEKMSGYETLIGDLGSRIATVSEQIAAINATIENLKKTDEEIKEYVKNIQAPASDLKESIAATDKKIDEVKTALDQAIADAKASDSAMKEELVKSIEDAKADVISQLSSLRTEMTGKLEQINETITSLESKSKEIEGKITELNTLVTEQIASTKDWVSATFVTLEEYSAIVTDVASLKETVNSLTTSLAEMETKLKTQWKSDIETAIAPVKKQVEDAITSITDAYTAAISAAKSEVTEAYRAEMKVAINDLEESLKSWVNSKFDAYWTSAESQAKLDAQKTDLEAQLKAQKEYLEGLIDNLKTGTSESENKTLIDNLSKELESVEKIAADNASAIETLRSDLTAATETITNAYKDAITAAINEYDGKISEKIDTKISELNTTIDTKVAEINDKISALDIRVKTLEDSLSDIKSQISALQDEINALKDKISNIIGKMVSISYIPTYSDGAEVVPYSIVKSKIVPGSFTMRFEIQPASLAEDVASTWNKALSAKGVYTRTRASYGDFVNFTIKAVSSSEGILSITLDASELSNDFFNSILAASIRISITDPTSKQTISSSYIPLTHGKIGDFVDPSMASKGDYAMKDGSFVSRSKKILLTEAQIKNCAGIVFWTTKDTDYTDTKRTNPAKLDDDIILMTDYPECTHGLIVALFDVSDGYVKWQNENNVDIYSDFQNTSLFNPTNKEDYKPIDASLNDKISGRIIQGYQNTKILKAYNEYCTANNKNDCIVNPIVSIENYEQSNPAPENSSGWYFPSYKEFHMLVYKDVDITATSENKVDHTFLDESFNVVGGNPPGSDTYLYWTSTTYGKGRATYASTHEAIGINYCKTTGGVHKVRAICAF